MNNAYSRDGIPEVDLRRKSNLEITLREYAAPILILALTASLYIAAELIDQKMIQEGLEYKAQSELYESGFVY